MRNAMAGLALAVTLPLLSACTGDPDRAPPAPSSIVCPDASKARAVSLGIRVSESVNAYGVRRYSISNLDYATALKTGFIVKGATYADPATGAFFRPGPDKHYDFEWIGGAPTLVDTSYSCTSALSLPTPSVHTQS